LEELIQVAIQVDNVHCENEASWPLRVNPPKKAVTTTSTNTTVTVKRDIKALPNYIDESERKCRREAGLCIKCSNSGHTIKDCRVGWKVPKAKEEKGKVAEEEKSEELGKE
jgi:hypothetical protein